MSCGHLVPFLVLVTCVGATRPPTGGLADKVAGGKKFRQELQNFMDVQYSAEVRVGPQKLKAILDTGSFEVLVFSKECKTCGKAGVYMGNKSPTYSKGALFSHTSFGSGSALGNEAFDDITVGPLSKRNFSFWEVVKAELPVAEQGTFQAIVGVGPPNSARLLAEQGATEAKNLSRALRGKGVEGLGFHFRKGIGAKQKKDIESALRHAADKEVVEAVKTAKGKAGKQSLTESFGVTEFSVCIGQRSTSPGFFVWNDDARFDAALKPAFHKIAVVGKIHWGVDLQDAALHTDVGSGVTVKTPLGCASGCGAVLDSGTSLIAAPSAVVEAVGLMLTAIQNNCSRLDEMPDLVFMLSGREYRLPPAAYVGEVTEDVAVGEKAPGWLGWLLPPRVVGYEQVAVCKPLLLNLDKDTQFGPMWILGMPFFRHYYTTFVSSKSKQELYAAPAGEQCHPDKAAVLVGAGGARARSHQAALAVRTSTLRMPRWAAEASGYIQL